MVHENVILKIINEEIKIFESENTMHSYERIMDRVKKMSYNHDITSQEAKIIEDNLNSVLNYTFNPNKSYGILLGSFKPNPQSELYTNANMFNRGIPFYQIISNDGIFAKDSTGDEIWGIISNNKITTVMLRKRLQREYASNDRMHHGGLGVDNIILDFDEFKQQELKNKLKPVVSH